MKDYYGYKVSEDGVVYSKATSKPMTPHLNGRGYLILGLRVDGRSVCKSLHRILAECYIPNPDRLSDVDHIDGDRLNNSLSNLRWVSHSDNIKHSYTLSNRSATGERNSMAKLSDVEVHHICSKLSDGWSSIGIHRVYHYPYSTVRKIKARRQWLHISSKYYF